MAAKEPTAEEKSAEESAEAKLAEEPTAKDQLDDGAPSDVVEVLGGKEGELSAGEQSAGEQSDDRDVVEVPVKELKLRRSTRSSLGKPAEKLSYHAFLPSTSYSTLLNNAEADIDLPELDHDLDMKNAFLQRKLDRVLYMYQSDYYNDETDRVFKLLKSLYGLKQTPLLWYKALDDVLTGADWKKSQVDEALYFKSEYVAATEVGKEACRLRFLLAEFQLLDVGKPTMLHVENQSAITVAEGLGLKGNLKHMDRRYAWL
ncbi:unnamed protein product [Closterium sp. NIES-53]